MLIKILGFFDLVAGLILIFSAGFGLPFFVLWFFGIILLLKSMMGLLQDFPSWVDFIGGSIFLLSIIFQIPSFIGIIIGILIIQKGIFSFV